MSDDVGRLTRLLHVLAAHAGSDSLGDDAMEALCAELQASAVWVYVVDPAGALRLVGKRGLPASVASQTGTLSADAPELAARVLRTGQSDELSEAIAGGATSTGEDLVRSAGVQLRAVALRAQEKTVGVVTYASAVRAITKEWVQDIAALLAIAVARVNTHAAAVALQTQLELAAKTTRELSEHLTRAPETVHGVVREAESAGFNLRHFLKLLAERARELVGAELSAVGVGSDPAKPFDPWVAVGMVEEVVQAIGRTPRPVGALGAVACRGETLRLRELVKHPYFVGLPASHPEIRSFLAVPIPFRGEIIGNLYLANKVRGEEFTAEDQRAVELLAALAATGLGQSIVLSVVARERATLLHILEAAPDGVLFVDATSGHLLASQACETLLGQPIDPAKGTEQYIGRLCWPDGRPLRPDELPSTHALRGTTTPGVEMLVVRPDGKRTPVTERAAPVRDTNDRIIGAVVAFRDVSAEKQLLRAKDELLYQITSEKNRLRQVIESSPDGMMFVEAATGHLVVSKSMSEIFGRAFVPDKGARQKLGLLCWPDGRPLTEDELPSSRVLRGEPMLDQELCVVRPDGRRIPLVERAVPVHDEQGNVMGVVVMLRDMTAQKEVERLREEFAAMVAHDLRNPIQSVLLQINMLRKTIEEGKPPAPAVFDRLLRSGTRLSQLATDLLDSTRIELSRVRLDTVRLDVPQAVESILERVRPTLGDHEVIFEARGRTTAALLDPMRLDQVLTNLLENAAKYSADGTPIRIVVAEADGGVEISVRDQGMGIAPDEVPKLFDRFYQTKRAREQKTGLGLGLYITKGFVEAHGGHISVESVPDRGSTFRVWFPAAPLAEDCAPRPGP